MNGDSKLALIFVIVVLALASLACVNNGGGNPVVATSQPTPTVAPTATPTPVANDCPKPRYTKIAGICYLASAPLVVQKGSAADVLGSDAQAAATIVPIPPKQ